jgi:hypothetical protein
MTFVLICGAFAGGYATAIFTWEKVSTWFVGAETKIRAFEDKIKSLRGKL